MIQYYFHRRRGLLKVICQLASAFLNGWNEGHLHRTNYYAFYKQRQVDNLHSKIE